MRRQPAFFLLRGRRYHVAFRGDYGSVEHVFGRFDGGDGAMTRWRLDDGARVGIPNDREVVAARV